MVKAYRSKGGVFPFGSFLALDYGSKPDPLALIEGYKLSNATALDLAQSALARSAAQRMEATSFLAVAGQPGSGKSTFSRGVIGRCWSKGSVAFQFQPSANGQAAQEILTFLSLADRDAILLLAAGTLVLVAHHRQHESVEAGRIFAQLQEAGMKTVRLEEIVRQKDSELKQTVEQLARGEVGLAIAGLDRQGRIHEVRGPEERIAAIAKEYAKSPENTLVVSPDNRSRTDINQAIHKKMQAKGVVGKEEHPTKVLVPRQDLTGADRMWAARYNECDVLRYSRNSQETGIPKGEYARVKQVDAPNNRLTVELSDGTEKATIHVVSRASWGFKSPSGHQG
jgi:ABC-type cobalamin/Fe3+-siderophores transport system ATPase subunit